IDALGNIAAADQALSQQGVNLAGIGSQLDRTSQLRLSRLAIACIIEYASQKNSGRKVIRLKSDSTPALGSGRLVIARHGEIEGQAQACLRLIRLIGDLAPESDNRVAD